MMSASLSALAHAGCPATSLRSSCVGMCLVISRRRCTSTVAPVFSAKAPCTFCSVSCLFRTLLLNSVGWRVFRPVCDPTLSGPVPVTVVRPCLSVYVVRQPAFNTKVWSCMDWSCFCSHAASLVAFLKSVDEVVRIVLLMSKTSCAAWCRM